MRHRKSQVKFGRKTREQRKALLRSLVTALFTHGKIQTTSAKAKAIQPIADRLISKAKKKDKVNAIREIKKIIYTVEASKNVMNKAAAINNRSSGFTRIIPLAFREGDAAKIVQIEFVDITK